MRLIRACHELGITAVAVFSDADRASLHVLKADEAYGIGPAPATESYLNISRIIDTAKRCKADAIHPGYGFLSENAAFAQACVDAGIKFIGPSPQSIDLMGSKTRARQQMEKAGVPFVPGSSRGLESLASARDLAVKLGYPVMLKAAADLLAFVRSFGVYEDHATGVPLKISALKLTKSYAETVLSSIETVGSRFPKVC